MAVLTALDLDDAAGVCAAYGLPPPEGLEGVAGGSVNSNFGLVTGGRRLFLRLYEERDRAGAEREAGLLERLASAGIPTPAPLARLDGARISVVRGKPAALLPWIEGDVRCQAGVTPGDTAKVGEALGRVHLAGQREAADPGRFEAADLALRLDRVERGGDPVHAPGVPALRVALAGAQAARNPALPRGLTHGDLFRDNVLWRDGGELAALLDFESACDGPLVYDLMVTVLSWCFGDDLDSRLATALCQGYERARPLTAAERRGLHAEARFAALRFTVTRITDYALRDGAAGPRVVKDWRRFRDRHARIEELGAGGLRRALGMGW